MIDSSLGERLVRLDAWLETMRQPDGYGGPVVHWWQHTTRFCAPGLDWRYEGLLDGYALLYRTTGEMAWRESLERAANHLIDGQREDGSFRSSGFERNPISLGTPHEAAASLGLLAALHQLSFADRALVAVRRNLDNLIARLWDGHGFNDRPGVPGRVPNKLATLAHALLLLAREGEDHYLPYAVAALDDVVRHQVAGGRHAGAVHQYSNGPAGQRGDGRFFPYYNARCIPPLVAGAQLLDRPDYLACAEGILDFLDGTMNEDGSWPQVVYERGKTAEWPRWYAAVADMLYGYRILDAKIPEVALDRLLASQLPNGAFPTARGFACQAGRAVPEGDPDWRDVLPVVGWNDKVFRLLALLAMDVDEPRRLTPATLSLTVRIGNRGAHYTEEVGEMRLVDFDGTVLYRWLKHEPWARRAHREASLR